MVSRVSRVSRHLTLLSSRSSLCRHWAFSSTAALMSFIGRTNSGERASTCWFFESSACGEVDGLKSVEIVSGRDHDKMWC